MNRYALKVIDGINPIREVCNEIYVKADGVLTKNNQFIFLTI